MHNLKKYFGILDYALRVFSKCFPLYGIPLNISTLFRPVHCVNFYKITFKRSSLYEAHTELIKAKIQLKTKETAHQSDWRRTNTLETSAFKLFTVANLRHQLSIKKYLDNSIENIYASFLWVKVVYATFFLCRKLNYPSAVQFCGAALHKEGEQLKAVLVIGLLLGPKSSQL